MATAEAGVGGKTTLLVADKEFGGERGNPADGCLRSTDDRVKTQPNKCAFKRDADNRSS